MVRILLFSSISVWMTTNPSFVQLQPPGPASIQDAGDAPTEDDDCCGGDDGIRTRVKKGDVCVAVAPLFTCLI